MMPICAALTGREVKYAPCDLSAVEADGTFSGYASLFGVEDLGGDCVEAGAFTASLARRGPGGVKLLYQHDAAEPIGVWLEICEDAKGLFVRGRLMTDLARGREVLSLMRSGVLDGLSIGYRTVRGRLEKKTGIRHLLEIDLWEISIVTFPMLPGARVETVKTAEPTMSLTRRNLERRLTQDAGLTRKQARVLMRSGFGGLAGMHDAAERDENLDRLRTSMVRATHLLRKARSIR